MADTQQNVPAQAQVQEQAQPPKTAQAALTSKALQQLPLRMTSTVVRGFGRGSHDLGIPTANLDQSEGNFHCRSVAEMAESGTAPTTTTTPTTTTNLDHKDLPTGIYWGFARIINSKNSEATASSSSSSSSSNLQKTTYTTACSIGYNPTYGNTYKTIEPHLIAQSSDPQRHASSCGESVLGDFYGQSIRMSLVGYLRPELPFEGLDSLVQAIKKDIQQSQALGDVIDDDLTIQEKRWVTSDEPLLEV